MPIDTFTGLILSYGNAGTPGVSAAGLPAWAPSQVADLHAGGAVMWVAGDGLMFALMMLVYLLWSMDDRAAVSGHGWLEAARRTSLANLVAAHPSRPTAAAGDHADGSADGTAGAAPEAAWTDSARGGIDDDEHLAAYNAFLARLNQAEPGRRP